MLALCTNLSHMEFQVRYWALLLLFTVIGSFWWFWMSSVHKIIQLMLEFLKAPFLVLHFSWYTLMTFLMMLSVILLFDYTTLYSKWSGFWSVATTSIGFWTWVWSMRHWTGARNGLLISMLGKLNWFRLTVLITLLLLMWKWMGLFLRNNHQLRCWGWPSLLNCIGALMLSLLLKLPPRKLET